LEIDLSPVLLGFLTPLTQEAQRRLTIGQLDYQKEAGLLYNGGKKDYVWNPVDSLGYPQEIQNQVQKSHKRPQQPSIGEATKD
jgi:hypothetical protein